ncbi:MAG: lysophospholipid acyltransferase family protein, partial [Thermoplasmatota archaeon]
MAWLWRPLRAVAIPVVKLAVRLEVVGQRHIPGQGAALLVSNHTSRLDHLVLPAATRRPLVNVGRPTLLARPFLGRVSRALGIVAAGAGSGLGEAEAALRGGALVCIYPEGARSPDGRLHRGHSGAARLALTVGCPVIPVAMVGTREAWPPGKALRPLRRARIVVGCPLLLEGSA